MALLGLPFEIDPAGVEAPLPAEHSAPARVAMRLARAKAADVAARRPGRLVVGADTIVVLGRRLLGKPADEEEARAMLRALAGRAHRVVTGIALIDSRQAPARIRIGAESTRVLFRALDEREIAAYVATGEPLDKAGAYAVQGFGSLLISGVYGDYPNVVGLPVARLVAMLREAGVEVLGVGC